MPIKFTLAVSFLLIVTSFARAQSIAKPDTNVYTVVQKAPEFPGGMRALGDYMKANVAYPEAARRARIDGKEFVSFVVETDGRINNAQVIKGIGFGCGAEALRVIRAMPPWTPGSQDGRPLRVKYNLVVRFGPDMDKR